MSTRRSARVGTNSKSRREAEAPRARFHPDDPRSWCHCQLVRRPVALCASGRCRRVPPPGVRNRGQWCVPDFFAGSEGVSVVVPRTGPPRAGE